MDVNTDSYLKPTAQPSTLDIAGKLGGLQQQAQQIQSGALQINQQKLDQANQAFGYMTRAMTSLGPNATKDQYKAVGENAAKMGLVPADMLHVWEERVDSAPDSPTFFKQALGAFADHQQQLNLQTGAPAEESDSANLYQGKRDPITGAFKPATSLPVQVPPTQAIQGPTGAPGIVGPSGAAGVRPVSGGLPVQQPSVSAPAPVAAPAKGLRAVTSGPTGPTVDVTPKTPTDFNNRFSAAFPNAVATGPAPGVAGAQNIVGEQSGKDYAAALQKAGSIGADLQPDLAVLNIVKNKNAGDFGPGTGELNQLKKLAVTWLPNVDPKLINDSSDYDTVKKYLVQGARSTGNTGSDNQLAAAFEGNPNTTMNTATIENIVKSRVALKKMEAAQALMANQQGVSPDQFSRWKAQNQNVLDPRAFGFDLMNPDARTKLMSSFGKIDKGSGQWIAKDKDHQQEFNKFEKSVNFANDANLIEPPGRQ